MGTPRAKPGGSREDGGEFTREGRQGAGDLHGEARASETCVGGDTENSAPRPETCPPSLPTSRRSTVRVPESGLCSQGDGVRVHPGERLSPSLSFPRL